MPKFDELAAEYKKLWDTVAIRPEKADKVAEVSKRVQALKSTYQQVSVATGVPWFVIGAIHNLESSLSLEKHLHNGDPLSARTVRVPAGHPAGSPPFTWAQSAIDALKLKGLQNVDKWTIERISYELERYNGMGYRNQHPEVKSPYLWSFTNHYSQGKYVGDHKFSATAVSDQVGAIAVLKHLVQGGLDIAAQGPVEPPPPPPPPVPTGRYEVDKRPFELPDKVDGATTDDSFFVMRDASIEKLAEVGDGTWWKIRVTSVGGPPVDGFAKREWLRPILMPQAINEDHFAKASLDAARQFGTSAHFLVALADAESGIVNKPFPAGPFGPFAMTKEDWSTYNAPAETGASESDRFNPYSQVAVAARLVVKLTEDLRPELPDKRLPTSEELYLARIVTPKGVKALLAAQPNDLVRKGLENAFPNDVISAMFELRPLLLTNTANVESLQAEVARRLTAGLTRAVTLIQKVEPELTIGPPETTDDKNEVPWMTKAKGELAKGVKEFENGSNPEIEKYFEVTTIGKHRDETAWCGAFVSWCIKVSGGSQKPVKYSALAADWLNNGEKLPGPVYGAIAVTKPLVKGASGHVGFVVAWDGGHVTFLGGNQGDKVCEQKFKIGDVRGWRMV